MTEQLLHLCAIYIANEESPVFDFGFDLLNREHNLFLSLANADIQIYSDVVI
jgi:hypothetical protein